MHLLDTDVVWALRYAHAEGDEGGLRRWVSDVSPSSLFLSVVTLMELESGTARLQRKERVAGAAVRAWLEEQVLPAFDGRVLPINAAVARRWAQLAYTDPRDGLLAATALEHGVTLVTRETAGFKGGRVRTFNPWAYKPSADRVDWYDDGGTGSVWLKTLFR